MTLFQLDREEIIDIKEDLKSIIRPEKKGVFIICINKRISNRLKFLSRLQCLLDSRS